MANEGLIPDSVPYNSQSGDPSSHLFQVYLYLTSMGIIQFLARSPFISISSNLSPNLGLLLYPYSTLFCFLKYNFKSVTKPKRLGIFFFLFFSLGFKQKEMRGRIFAITFFFFFYLRLHGLDTRGFENAWNSARGPP